MTQEIKMNSVPSMKVNNELYGIDYRLSVFEDTESANCPICSVFAVCEGFEHCSSFCSTEATLRLSRHFEVITVEESGEKEPLDWVREDLNRVKLSIRRVKRYRSNLQESDYTHKMGELRAEGIRLMNLLEESVK